MLFIDSAEFCAIFDEILKNDKEYTQRTNAFKKALMSSKQDDIGDAFESLTARMAEICYIRGFKEGMNFVIKKEIMIK